MTDTDRHGRADTRTSGGWTPSFQESHISQIHAVRLLQKRGLMQRLLTGKVRVSGAEQTGTEGQ